jgi:hypothetical protein
LDLAALKGIEKLLTECAVSVREGFVTPEVLEQCAHVLSKAPRKEVGDHTRFSIWRAARESGFVDDDQALRFFELLGFGGRR